MPWVACRRVQTLDLDDDVVGAEFVLRPPLSPEAKSSVQIPNYVASLNSGGSAFLVQASVGGSAVFFCNDDMAAAFVTAREAEAIYGASLADPDAVMHRLVAPRDRPAYLRAVADLLVRQSDLLCETSLLVHVHARRGPPVLCLAQMRASFSADGEAVVFGIKLIPMPDSDYLPLKTAEEPAPYPHLVWSPEAALHDPHAQDLGGLYAQARAHAYAAAAFRPTYYYDAMPGGLAAKRKIAASFGFQAPDKRAAGMPVPAPRPPIGNSADAAAYFEQLSLGGAAPRMMSSWGKPADAGRMPFNMPVAPAASNPGAAAAGVALPVLPAPQPPCESLLDEHGQDFETFVPTFEGTNDPHATENLHHYPVGLFA
jgi:hypothetical protein